MEKDKDYEKRMERYRTKLNERMDSATENIRRLNSEIVNAHDLGLSESEVRDKKWTLYHEQSVCHQSLSTINLFEIRDLNRSLVKVFERLNKLEKKEVGE